MDSFEPIIKQTSSKTVAVKIFGNKLEQRADGIGITENDYYSGGILERLDAHSGPRWTVINSYRVSRIRRNDETIRHGSRADS